MRTEFTDKAQGDMPLVDWLAAAVQDGEPSSPALREKMTSFAVRSGADPEAAGALGKFLRRLAAQDPDQCFTIAECGARVAARQSRNAVHAVSPMIYECARGLLAAAEYKARDLTRLEEAFDDLPVVLGYAKDFTGLKKRTIETALRMARPVMLVEPDMYHDLMDSFSQIVQQSLRSEARGRKEAFHEARKANGKLNAYLARQRQADETRVLETLVPS